MEMLSMVSSLSLLFNRNMIFRLKNGSSRQLFVIPQLYTWRRNLHAGFLALTIRNVLIYSNLKSLRIVSFCFPSICFFFDTYFTFQIMDDIDSVAVNFSADFPIFEHLSLWIYWFYLNNLDIICIFCHCIYEELVC